MRKVLSVILIITILFSLSACNLLDNSKTTVSIIETAQAMYSPEKSGANNNSPEKDKANNTPDKPIKKPTENNPPVSNTTPSDTEEEEDIITADELVGVNKLRVDYDLGTCRDLSGDVSVVLFYMDDFESSWTSAEITKFTEYEVKPALDFLEDGARQHGVELNLSVKKTYSSLFYDEEVIVSVKQTGLATIDVLYQAALGLNYSSDDEMIAEFKEKYGTEVVCLTMFNKNGDAYALNPARGETIKVVEHCIIFAYDLDSNRNDPIGSQASVVAHETLHLFGAEDYYKPDSRKALATTHFPADIMLYSSYYIARNTIEEATAFYIGWTDEVPDVLYNENW